MVASRQGDGLEPVVVEGVFRVLADRIGQLGQHGGAKLGHFFMMSFGLTGLVFLGHAASSGK